MNPQKEHNMLRSKINKHTIFSLYLLVFVIILIGNTFSFGLKHTPLLLLFFIPYLIVYAVFNRFHFNIKNSFNLKFNYNIVLSVLSIVSIALIILHFIFMGGLPAFEGLSMNKISEVAQLRKEIGTRSPGIWNYFSSINIKALLPFLLLVTLILKKKRLYWVLFFCVTFYSFSLMQKSHILSALVPVLIFMVFEKKWAYVLKYLGTICSVIVLLVIITNPQLRGGVNDLNEKTNQAQQQDSKTKSISSGLFKRVIITPGSMVGEWFEIIPEQKPFLNGNGYGFYSRLSGQEFHNYSKELYPLIYTDNYNKGLEGSVNVAHFMREYSNFGKTGLVLSGIFTALFFVLLNQLFRDSHTGLKLAVNFFPIMLLSSGSLLTILLSGGWFIFILLYFLFQNEIELKR